MGELIITVGLPRSGKSTWISKNKEDAIVVSNDWIRENILGHSYSSSSNAIVWAISDATLRIILGQNKNVIFDGINHTKFVREFYINLARKYNASVKIVYFDVSLETCINRNRTISNKLPEDSLLAIGKEFEKPTIEECDEIVIVKES